MEKSNVINVVSQGDIKIIQIAKYLKIGRLEERIQMKINNQIEDMLQHIDSFEFLIYLHS